MASDHNGGDVLDAGAGESRPEAAAELNRDELRNRMRLRLAATHSAARQPAQARPSSAPAVAPVQLSPAGQPPAPPPAVSQLVWTSVLDSLATNGSTPDPAGRAGVTSTADQQAIADLFAAARRPDFSHLAGVSTTGLGVAPATSATVVPDISGSVAPATSSTVAPATSSTVAPTMTSAAASATAIAVAERVADPAIDPPATDGMIVPAMPTLSPPSRAPAARPGQGRADEVIEPEPAGKESKKNKGKRAKTTSAPKRKDRHPFRTFVSFVLVLAMLGGAAYAGWYYLLRKKVQWSEDVEPFALIVETTLGQEFVEEVPIETLSAPEYEVKLGIQALADTYPDADGGFTTMRAAGLVPVTPSPAVAGRALAVFQPAFYKPEDGAIYRVDDSSSVADAAMIKALSLALMDQELRWFDAMRDMSDAQRVGYRTLLDGAAKAVLDIEFDDDDEFEATYTAAVDSLQTSSAAAEVPLYAALHLASYQIGGELAPIDDETNLLAELSAPPSDAVIFDPVRPADSAPTAPVLPDAAVTKGRTMGMQFWYMALTPALGAAARDAALLWTADTTSTTDSGTGQACLNSSITTASEVEQAVLLAALTQWVQSRPATSQATIASQPANGIQVTMCEPAEGNPEVLATPTSDSLYTAVGVERAFLAQATELDHLPGSPAARHCALVAFRGGSVANYTPGSLDADVRAQMTTVVNFCKNG